MSVVAIIQARMGSTRLPGKVLRELQGTTILGHVIRRARACPGVDRVVVAIPDTDEDRVLIAEAHRHRAEWFAGSHDDVLRRYAEAARQFGAETVIRITSDCPLLDPEVAGLMLDRYTKTRAEGRQLDYLSNIIQRTFPRGLDTEIFSAEALQRADREAADPQEREHVTLYLYRHPERFALGGYENPAGDWSHLRWTVDTEDDLRMVTVIYQELHRKEALFGMRDILQLLQHSPELSEINAGIDQKIVD